MHHGYGAFCVFVLQVCIELAQLLHQKHAFINYGAAGEGCDVGARSRRCASGSCTLGGGSHALFKFATHQKQKAVEFDAWCGVCWALHKHLPDGRHAIARTFAQHFWVCGHFAPAN